jgi:phenylpyruvate tautomerase PptA (4-oxalocrotonate tautomerase family)
MTISEHDETDFAYSPTYLGIARSDDLILIQMTVSNTRPREKKQALFRQIVENLKADPGVRPEDVFINLVEVLPENWSFGNGIAQYVADKG